MLRHSKSVSPKKRRKTPCTSNGPSMAGSARNSPRRGNSPSEALRNLIAVNPEQLINISTEELEYHIADCKNTLPPEPLAATYETRCDKLQREIHHLRTQLDRTISDINGKIEHRMDERMTRRDLSQQWQLLRKQLEQIKLPNVNSPKKNENGTVSNSNPEYLALQMTAIREKHDSIYRKYRAILPSNVTDYISTDNCIEQLLHKAHSLHKEIATLTHKLHITKSHFCRATLVYKLSREQLTVLERILDYKNEQIKARTRLEEVRKSRKDAENECEISEQKRREKKAMIENKLQTITDELESLNESTTNSDEINSNLKQQKTAELQKPVIERLLHYLQNLLLSEDRAMLQKIAMTNSSDEALAELLSSRRESYHKFHLTHPMSIFDDFDCLDITIPLDISDVPSTIHQLQCMSNVPN